MRTAKVTEVRCEDGKQGQYGTTYGHWLTMDNGDKGICNKKKQNAFEVGQEITYEIEMKTSKSGNSYGVIKESQPANGFNGSFNGGGFKGGVTQSKDASFALAYAKDQTVAMIEAGALVIPEGKTALGTIKEATLWLAKEYTAWLKEQN